MCEVYYKPKVIGLFCSFNMHNLNYEENPQGCNGMCVRALFRGYGLCYTPNFFFKRKGSVPI